MITYWGGSSHRAHKSLARLDVACAPVVRFSWRIERCTRCRTWRTACSSRATLSSAGTTLPITAQLSARRTSSARCSAYAPSHAAATGTCCRRAFYPYKSCSLSETRVKNGTFGTDQLFKAIRVDFEAFPNEIFHKTLQK